MIAVFGHTPSSLVIDYSQVKFSANFVSQRTNGGQPTAASSLSDKRPVQSHAEFFPPRTGVHVVHTLSKAVAACVAVDTSRFGAPAT